MRKWYRVHYHFRGEPKNYRVVNIQAFNRDDVKRQFKKLYVTAVIDGYKLYKGR